MVGGLLLVSDSGAGGEKKSANKADGVWVLVGMERNGMKVADDVIDKLKMKLSIMGTNYTVTVDGKLADKGTSKVDTTKMPNTVASKPGEGPNQGKTILAIREVDGDSMKACYDLEGKKRPTEFKTTEGSGHVLVFYRRER